MIISEVLNAILELSKIINKFISGNPELFKQEDIDKSIKALEEQEKIDLESENELFKK